MEEPFSFLTPEDNKSLAELICSIKLQGKMELVQELHTWLSAEIEKHKDLMKGVGDAPKKQRKTRKKRV